MINAIVVWNTRHFDRAQVKPLEQGEQVADTVWQHLSPLAWKHINLVGSYQFTEVTLEEEFRPLREGESRRARQRRIAPSSPTDASGEKTESREMEYGENEEQPLVQLSLLQESEDA